jgi:hypothetical protein
MEIKLKKQKVTKKNCIICEKEANAKNSHIVPMNLIKDCIGKRYNEISLDIEFKNINKIEKKIYLGDNIKHNYEELNKDNLELINENPYTLDNILCQNCEDKLGIIEGKVYSEIINKVRDKKYKQNFNFRSYNEIEIVTINHNRISNNELIIYFFSIILRYFYYIDLKNKNTKTDLDTINSISKLLNTKLNNQEQNLEFFDLKIMVILTDNPKIFPALSETNKFEKHTIFACHFIMILDKLTEENLILDKYLNGIYDNEFKILNNNISEKGIFNITKLLT